MRRLEALMTIFVVSSLLLSIFLMTAVAVIGDRVPEFPVIPEVITGTALLATYLVLRRKNRNN